MQFSVPSLATPHELCFSSRTLLPPSLAPSLIPSTFPSASNPLVIFWSSPMYLTFEEQIRDGVRFPRENLETLLGRRLPQREEAVEMDDVSLSCCVCYAYRLPAEDGQPGALTFALTASISVGSSWV